MAGTTQQTMSLDAVIAIANGFSGITAAKQGYTRYADSSNLEATIVAQTANSQGYFACWLKSCEIANAETLPFQAIGELLVYVPKDTSVDMSVAWDFAINFATAIQNPATYEALSTPIPFPERVRFSLHKVDVIRARGIAIFDFGAYGNGGIDFIDP